MKRFLTLNHPLLKKHFSISITGFILGALLYYYFSTSGLETSAFKSLEALFAGVCGALLAEVSFWISQRLDKRMPWQTQIASRFLSGILVHFAFAYLFGVAVVSLYRTLFLDSILEFDVFSDFQLKLGILLFIIFLLYNIIYFALYSYYSYTSLQIESVKIEREHIDLQLKALKSQLSAHFLFNNLNTISELAHQDANSTEHYIRELAKIYSYSLKSYNSKLVVLKDELTLVIAYLDILKTRFGEVFKFNLDIDDELLPTQIPPLTLQMLVENAVKHNQMHIDAPLSIQIKGAKNTIIVANSISETPKSVQSFKIGLDNIKKRYQLLSNKEVSIEKNDYFTVKLPVIS